MGKAYFIVTISLSFVISHYFQLFTDLDDNDDDDDDFDMDVGEYDESNRSVGYSIIRSIRSFSSRIFHNIMSIFISHYKPHNTNNSITNDKNIRVNYTTTCRGFNYSLYFMQLSFKVLGIAFLRHSSYSTVMVVILVIFGLYAESIIFWINAVHYYLKALGTITPKYVNQVNQLQL